MDQLFLGVWRAITPSKISIDNYTSRLHYQLAFGICLAATAFLGGEHFIGGPITCISSSNHPLDTIKENRCWKTGTQKCLKGAETCDDNNKCQYDDGLRDLHMEWYQHGILILFLNAVVFRIGHQIWKCCEGGVMRQMYSDDAKAGNRKKMDEVLEEKATLYQQMRGDHPNPHRLYYAWSVFSQFIDILVVIGIFVFNNAVLQGNQFLNYGIAATTAIIHPRDGYSNTAMCNMFPIIETRCDLKATGAGFGAEAINASCALNQNVYNQYIYFVLWFLYCTLIIVGVVQLMFEAVLIFRPSLRTFLIERQLGTAMRAGDREIVSTCLGGGRIGDWFLLYQIGKNMERQYFMGFLRRVAQLNTEAIPLNQLQLQQQQNAAV